MFAPPARPEGLDHHGSFRSCRVVAKARPRPILWFFDQASNYGVAVFASQLFSPLFFCKHVEIVLAGLPEGALFTSESHGQFDCLDGLVERT